MQHSDQLKKSQPSMKKLDDCVKRQQLLTISLNSERQKIYHLQISVIYKF